MDFELEKYQSNAFDFNLKIFVSYLYEFIFDMAY
jgi:hypothetical protein